MPCRQIWHRIVRLTPGILKSFSSNSHCSKTALKVKIIGSSALNGSENEIGPCRRGFEYTDHIPLKKSKTFPHPKKRSVMRMALNCIRC